MMHRLRAFFLNLVTVVGSVAFTLLVLEGLLRLLPVARAPPVEPPTADNPIQRYAPSQPFTWSLGWNFVNVVHGHSNAQGFIADYDYDPAASSPLVAVAGDSFIEGLRVPFAETLTGRLAAALGARGRAYAFAQSGSPLSQYVAYAAHACGVYHPERLVVVVVGNDFDESVYAHRRRNGIFHLYPRADGGFDYRLTPLPAPGLVQRVARRSALALYLMRNVGISEFLGNMGISVALAAGPDDRYVGNTLADANPARVAEGEQVIAWFLETLPGAACLPARDIVLVVDAMRPPIYDDNELRAARASYFGRMRARLIAEAAAKDFTVVDMEAPLRAAYGEQPVPFEFPNDMHWNSRGHAVAAAAVLKALAAWPPLAAAARGE
jgi:SGNH hydrolase-like domain, acetyltransferase AlgX